MVATAPSRLRFGEYDIERKLGRGMTDVYLGFHAQRGRHAVLKLIRHSQDPAVAQVIASERRGASIQQQLHAFDPRVIEVYDFGDLEGCFFVALEYVEGENVAQVLRRERTIDPGRAARIAQEIASQLESLHSFQAQIDGRASAVVHGDIKPSNIQIGADGRIRLLDFGIAKCVTVLHELTVHNFGSPNYCSPERLDRSQVDTESDLWSLGVTLYEMLAGSPPYQANSTQKLEHLIQSKRPPRALPGSCPRPLRAVVGKALAADAAQRYGTAAIFREDLTAFLENRPTVAERERRRPWKVNPTVDAGGQQSRWHLPALPYARVLGAVACMLLGMTVFLGTGYYWRFHNEARRFRGNLDLTHRSTGELNTPWLELQRMRAEYEFLGGFSPVDQLEPSLRAAYLSAADAVIDGYRASHDPSIQSVDWLKAQAALEHVLEMGGADQATRGKLALVRGYLALTNALSSAGSNRVEEYRAQARALFTGAASAIPISPDPHLGLARLYVYCYHDTERTIAELTVAEALGYRLQAREIEQKADAYRFRAWQELGEAWGPNAKPADAVRLQSRGQRDLESAEMLYEQIPGFNHVDAHLRQVRAVYAKTLPSPPAVAAAPSPKPVQRQVKPRTKRWR
jgi:tRNA A-37 threonylcarbamoyl transferase component Bud32